MKIDEWYTDADRQERERVAFEVGTSVAYLRQVAKRYRNASPSTELKILQSIGGKVHCPLCGARTKTGAR